MNELSFSRRRVLQAASCGFGFTALQGLVGAEAVAARPLTVTACAKRVIFLFMSGGPAHLDTFDYKPQVGKKPHGGSAFKFAQHGESGAWASELMPHTARQIDKLCFLKGMYCDTGNHAQSSLQLHSGERLRKRPTLGSWVNYGLGTENEDLPGFVSLNTSKPQFYTSAFLPTVCAGTAIGVNGEDMTKATIPNVSGGHLSLHAKRRQLDFVQALNQRHLEQRPEDLRLEGVIKSLELGFRMQSAAPEILDISNETAYTLDRYNVGFDNVVGTCRQSDFGRQCLLARRFAEAGVRFIEVNHGSWDQHKSHRRDLMANCSVTDKPIAALLEDLEQRGLLDDTLVIWGGEFGRPGLVPGGKDETGHNPRGFTFWMAGGGVKRGFTHGATDETGVRAVAGKMHFRDLHATILHLMGLDHDSLDFHFEGRRHRLTGPQGGKVIREILA